MKFFIIIGSYSSFDKKLIENQIRKKHKANVFGISFLKKITFSEAIKEVIENLAIEPETDKPVQTVFVADSQSSLYEEFLNNDFSLESVNSMLALKRMKNNSSSRKQVSDGVEKVLKHFQPKFKRPSLAHALSR